MVSLDYRRGLPSRFDRSSNGLGAGPDETFALRASLLETIERDAVGEWLRSAPSRRAMTAIAVDGAPAWLGAWRDRLQAIGASLEIFACPSVTATPVLLCMVTAREEFGNAPRRFYGSAARGNPELALFAALAEALQSRLTLIAGARDDILPSHYRAGAAPPEAAGPARGRRDWAEIEGSEDGPAFLADRLRLAGYSQVAVKRLDAPPGVVVTKAFVPGLGSASRPRRRVVAA